MSLEPGNEKRGWGRVAWVFILALVTLAMPARGAISMHSWTGLGVEIPDGNPAGASDPRTVSSPVLDITSVTVNLNISTEFTGDLFVTLQHESGLAVLLNRTGRTASDPFGYADTGFNITLSDAISHDVHLYQDLVDPLGGVLTGVWEPDGRVMDPDVVVDTAPRDHGLGSFNGLDANGTWTLFMADLSSDVGPSVLNSWGLNIEGSTVAAVPEPVPVALALFAGVFAFGRLFSFWRRRKGR